MTSTVGPSFKVIFMKKILAGLMNSAWDPLKNVGHVEGSQLAVIKTLEFCVSFI